VIDQYRVTTDARSSIVNDPNREDDPRAILRLLGQVIHVSVETVRIIESLPDLGLPEG
jgi:predicted helicase